MGSATVHGQSRRRHRHRSSQFKKVASLGRKALLVIGSLLIVIIVVYTCLRFFGGANIAALRNRE